MMPRLGRFERCGDLPGDGQSFVIGIGDGGETIAEVGPSTFIANAISHSTLDAVDGSNIWVIQRGKHLGFTFEPGEAIGILRKSSGNILSVATSRLSFVSRAR